MLKWLRRWLSGDPFDYIVQHTERKQMWCKCFRELGE